jgi:polar amino acid transport system substrate-binding protein
MKRVFFVPVLIYVFAFIFLNLPAVADDHGNVLRVQFSLMSPWKMGDKGNERGVDIEFMQLLAKRMGVHVEFVHVPFVRGLEYMRSGSIDLMTGVLFSEGRAAYMDYINPPYDTHSNVAFYVRKGEADRIQRYEDLYGLRIGTTSGSKFFPRFDNDLKLKKRMVYRSSLNLMKLREGRIDTAIVSETLGDYLLKKMELEGVLEKAKFIYKKENMVFMAISKKSRFASRIDEFEIHMRHLIQTKEREKIKTRYLDLLR